MRAIFYFSTSDLQKAKGVVVVLIVVLILAATATIYYTTTQQSSPNASPTPAPSPEPTSSATPFSDSPTVPPIPRATITLRVTDTETEQFVDNVSVLVDGVDIGTTTQNGELEIQNLEYGSHRISIVPYYEQHTFEQYVNVSGDAVIPVSIDIPNPVFQAAIDVTVDYVAFHELGRVSITLSNTGQITSRETIALVFVYLEDNLDTPVENRIVDFGDIPADAQPIKKEIIGMDSFVWQKAERVAVAIVDRWKYTPKTDEVTGQEEVPTWFKADVLSYSYTYIEEHPEISGTIAKIIVAW